MAILIGFLLLLLSKNKGKVFVVDIKDEGFASNLIQIEQGDSIRFVNKGRQFHWPASNIHPTHQIYPEFDPKESLKPGESWEFMFEKSGKFRFHDHDFPALTGMIEVGPVSGYVTKFKLADITQEFERKKIEFEYKLFPEKLEQDLSNANVVSLAKNDEIKLFALVNSAGSDKLMKKLLKETDNGSKGDCHQPAHQVGRAAFKRIREKVFLNPDISCQSGFLHGAIEAFLNEKGIDNLGENVSELCDSFETSFFNFECLHGVGHGVLALSDYDLPKALEMCKTLNGNFAHGSCYGGVFMENMLTALGLGASSGHTTTWVNEDPYFPCNKIDQDESVQNQCYLMQTSVMLKIYKYDFSKVAKACDGAPGMYRETCFKSMGRDAAGQKLNNPEGINKICSDAPEGFRQVCLTGGLYVIMDFWGDKLTNQPKALCEIADPNMKEGCYLAIGVRLPDFFGNDQEKIKSTCAYSESEFQAVCLKAAGIS